MIAKLFSHLPFPGVPGSSVIIGGPPCPNATRTAHARLIAIANRRTANLFLIPPERRPAISTCWERWWDAQAKRREKEKVPAQIVLSAGKSAALWGRAPSFLRHVLFSRLERPPTSWRHFFSRSSLFHRRTSRRQAELNHRMRSRRRLRLSARWSLPCLCRYRASPSCDCGSQRTNDDAARPRQCHSVLLRVTGASEQLLH